MLWKISVQPDTTYAVPGCRSPYQETPWNLSHSTLSCPWRKSKILRASSAQSQGILFWSIHGGLMNCKEDVFFLSSSQQTSGILPQIQLTHSVKGQLCRIVSWVIFGSSTHSLWRCCRLRLFHAEQGWSLTTQHSSLTCATYSLMDSSWATCLKQGIWCRDGCKQEISRSSQTSIESPPPVK